MKKSEKFDGDLALVIRGQIDYFDEHFEDNLFFYDKGAERFIQINPILLYTLSTLYKTPVNDPIYDQFRKRTIARLENARLQAKEQGQSEVCDIIESGRLQLSLLLNTEGGSVITLTADIADFIKSKGGKISSFGGRKMFSTGADIFMLPPRHRRFLLKYSTLLFHLGSYSSGIDEDEEWEESDTGSDEEREEFKNEEIKELKELILKNTFQKKRKEMKIILANAFDKPDSDLPDCPVVFRGDRAAEFGLAKQVVDLSVQFDKVNNVTPEIYQGTNISNFFERTKSVMDAIAMLDKRGEW